MKFVRVHTPGFVLLIYKSDFDQTFLSLFPIHLLTKKIAKQLYKPPDYPRPDEKSLEAYKPDDMSAYPEKENPAHERKHWLSPKE